MLFSDEEEEPLPIGRDIELVEVRAGARQRRLEQDCRCRKLCGRAGLHRHGHDCPVGREAEELPAVRSPAGLNAAAEGDLPPVVKGRKGRDINLPRP